MSYGIDTQTDPNRDPNALDKPVTLKTLAKHKKAKEKFVVVALYDAPMAAMAQKCGVEVVLVGDSLGMTVLGYESTIPVTMDQMIYHVEAVARGNHKSLIIADLPFMTYATPEAALSNATRLMQAGAQMIKLEGGRWLAETVAMLSERGLPVCAHLGLTPQSVNKFGGFRVQGRNPEQAEQIAADARLLAESGADLLVLECVPSALAERITRNQYTHHWYRCGWRNRRSGISDQRHTGPDGKTAQVFQELSHRSGRYSRCYETICGRRQGRSVPGPGAYIFIEQVQF